MYEPLLSPENKHSEVGFFEEESTKETKPDANEEEVIEKNLQNIDKQIEKELHEVEEWTNEISKDFLNPLHPTLKELLRKSTEILLAINELKEDLFKFYKGEKIKMLLNKLFEILESLTKQLQMLSEILEVKDEEQEILNIHTKYESLREFALPIHKKSQICWKVLTSCIDYLLKNLLLDLHNTVHHLFKKKGKQNNEGKVNEIQIMIGKIRIVSEYLPTVVVFDQSDIFALEDNDPYLEELKEHVRIKVLGPSHKVKKSFKKFIRSIQIGMSAMSKCSDYNNEFAKKLTVSFGAVYYFFMPKAAYKQANLFYSQPIEKTAWQAWNFLEDKFILNMMKITFPSIRYAKKVYINKMFQPITLDFINEALSESTLNSMSRLNYNPEPKDKSEEITTLNFKAISPHEVRIKGLNKIPILVLSDREITVKKVHEIDIAPKNQCNIEITNKIVGEKLIEESQESCKNDHFQNINLEYDLSPTCKEQDKKNVHNTEKNTFFCGLANLCKTFDCFGVTEHEDLESYFDGLVIHIHGGGFVSMSSGSHQSYTRTWSKSLKKPVLSIDYRLAPENPYPAALDDCWQSYNWIINYAEEVLGIKPSKIIVTGDSAGANLAIGISVLALKCGVRVPDGLFLAYPALKLEPKAYTPSLMLALEDQLVPYSLLRLCLEAYVPSGADPSRDPLLSPVHLSNEILSKLPPTRIVVGESDPLHDECWRFTDKLRKVGNDVRLTVYKDMCHGFLGYDVPMGMPESKVCIQDAIEMIEELLKMPKKV